MNTDIDWHKYVTDNLDMPTRLARRHRRTCRTVVPMDELEATARLKLVVAARTYRPDGGKAFTSWAFTVINNGLYNLTRSHWFHYQNLNFVPTLPYDPSYEHPNQLDDAEEVGRLIQQACLSEPEKTVLRLRTEVGLSYNDIVDQYGHTYGHWHGTFHKAIGKLRMAGKG
jgi:RNA polymerase sigma factor (sigma-70 family)